MRQKVWEWDGPFGLMADQICRSYGITLTFHQNWIKKLSNFDEITKVPGLIQIYTYISGYICIYLEQDGNFDVSMICSNKSQSECIFTLLLIWDQTKFRFVPTQSENGTKQPDISQLTRIRTAFHCVYSFWKVNKYFEKKNF